MDGDVFLSGITSKLLLCLLSHAIEALQKRSKSSGRLCAFGALVGQVVLRGSIDGTALCVAEDKDELGAQGSGAELQASHDAAFRVHASVACVSQHKQVAGQSVEHQLQRHARVCAAKDGRVRGLSHRRQGASHLGINTSSNRRANSKPLIALLQQFQCLRRRHGRILWSSHAMGANECRSSRGAAHGGRQVHLARKELLLLRGRAPEFNLAGLQLVDCAVDLQFSSSGQLSNGLTELKQEVDRVENVHLHRRRRQLCGVAPSGSQLLRGLRSNTGEALQQAFQGTSRRLALGGFLDGKVRGGCARECSAVGVAHDDDEAAS
mmetsp:Transcript_13740/g.32771  ORF Transcript_13740/g.32771 Transcript_13740/m.32771 type:complete len:322 (+) Transcript_13740:279-1244(+)